MRQILVSANLAPAQLWGLAPRLADAEPSDTAPQVALSDLSTGPEGHILYDIDGTVITNN